ncbi:3-oxoacyl-[acyl-carrier-protein] reductase [Clostridium cavendishii DSM 21758]|uniref:3-oxoacyl-[acyl-carrier-protein] reductase n=1 Tax=Clostridium cavendishii DSM 21758 TaxID=1121302 RepID=A0A1M6KHN3_9CLOT|nr:3-oxoacyl-[acyl-carrier-protein] reductase [Clostridium cavendishii]SHJ58412.1 3-oxoacyl-[acyl-carrier-protein] reductase [Clostridium cavendishii DSM 21758]
MLKGKCAIVTGATRGIGRAIALKLASLGFNIVINYRSKDSEAETLKAEVEALGVKSLIVKGDISKVVEARELIEKAKEYFGTIDVLVNNAGITRDGLILRMKEEDFDNVIEVNLKGTFNCLKSVSPIMIKQRHGKIVNISSVIGLIGNAGQVNYAASKAGVIGMTKSLAKELGSRGINVNAVAPGFIDTDMTKELSEKAKEVIQTSIPLKRIGTTKDVAEVVGFLVSDASDYITGQVINIDGGMVM